MANMAIRVSTQNGEMEHVLLNKNIFKCGESMFETTQGKGKHSVKYLTQNILPRNVKNWGREAPYGCPD